MPATTVPSSSVTRIDSGVWSSTPMAASLIASSSSESSFSNSGSSAVTGWRVGITPSWRIRAAQAPADQVADERLGVIGDLTCRLDRIGYHRGDEFLVFVQAAGRSGLIRVFWKEV